MGSGNASGLQKTNRREPEWMIRHCRAQSSKGSKGWVGHTEDTNRVVVGPIAGENGVKTSEDRGKGVGEKWRKRKTRHMAQDGQKGVKATPRAERWYEPGQVRNRGIPRRGVEPEAKNKEPGSFHRHVCKKKRGKKKGWGKKLKRLRRRVSMGNVGGRLRTLSEGGGKHARR